MPDDFVAYGRSWMQHHRDWDFVLWTDSNVPPMVNSEIYRRCKSLAGKSNILRYELLLRHGGVYIDTDFVCQKNLEPLVKDDTFFVARQPSGLINNAIIGAVAGHPLLIELEEALHSRLPGKEDDMPSFAHSGPHFFAPIVERHSDVTVYGPELFYPYDWCERWRSTEAFPGAYAIHHWTLSGREADLERRRLCLSGQGNTAIFVCVTENVDFIRLEWVLEALCVQTESRFEVFVIEPDGVPDCSELVNRFGSRLSVQLVTSRSTHGARGSISELLEAALRQTGMDRIVLIDGDCVPAIDLVEVHSGLELMHTVAFGFLRTYPAQKLFRFRAPFDYPGLERNSKERWRDEGLYGDWRDAKTCPVGADREALQSVGKLPAKGNRLHYRRLVRMLCDRGNRLIALLHEAHATRLSNP